MRFSYKFRILQLIEMIKKVFYLCKFGWEKGWQQLHQGVERLF